jgi:DNA-binding CsgD family transcriptional regulator
MVKTEQIISLIQSGLNFSQTARELNCSRNTVKSRFWKYVQYNYVAMPNFWGLTEKEIGVIVLRKKNGENAQDIADDFGISKSYIYKLVKKWS